MPRARGGREEAALRQRGESEEHGDPALSPVGGASAAVEPATAKAGEDAGGKGEAGQQLEEASKLEKKKIQEEILKLKVSRC